MEKEMLLAELTKNCKKNNQKLMELMKSYELAKLGNEVQEQQIEDIYNRVLSENVFLAEKEISRGEVIIRKGDRITSDKYSFLLSDEDFDKFQKLSLPYLVSEKITDESSRYITNWHTIELQAMNDLVEFIILNIVPASMRDKFWEARHSVVFEHKLIDALQSCVKAA